MNSFWIWRQTDVYKRQASQTVERSPLAAPVADALGVAVFSHDLP